MDSPTVFVLAVALCLSAIVLVVFVVFKPRFGSIPLERRRLGLRQDKSAVAKVSQTAVNAVENVIGESGGPYNREVLYNAGLKLAPADFTVGVAIASVLVAAFAALLTHPLLGLLVGAATPFLAKVVLIILRDKRRAKFEEQLTDTIQMLIGGLRVGHSVLRSVEAAAQEADAPTSEELLRIVNETRIGKDARVAFDDVAERMDSEDFRWISQAIQINREVGGDLAEVLEQVAGTIRERSEIKGQIRSLSAEGKMSAYVLMAMPVGVAFILAFINPGYLNVFVEKPLGLLMLVAAVAMFTVGGFWMSRVVKIKF
ncbi:tight adherence protein B [Arthrobacter sp. SLBN-100]|uniref:type II secretion system F family protein n=1 Tax=Arthrobacter sp. SLBN-100 TaxID=2768450 RepID=UPI00115427BA|nr:type II secretion system F family protein [Arthrobacter sp. SLBN-100]TQJ67421.1 tight adherence protein B [Arthrobacter sp. SLBN-100]